MSIPEKPSILIVEDDSDIRMLLVEFLTREGYATEAVDGTAAADKALQRGFPDIIILDLMMRGEDGLSFCRRVRAAHQVPILILTAKGDEIDRILGLEMGADDYVAKPFNPRELLARIRAILRRTNGRVVQHAESAKKMFAGLTVDIEGRSITTTDGYLVSLTTSEFDLLACFLERPRRVLSRDQLLDWTRGKSADAFDRTIDVSISRLRTKLARCMRDDAEIIVTVRNAGYLFNLPVIDA